MTDHSTKAVRKSAFPLRMPQSLRDAAERLAKLDGVSVNQFVATAVAEKIASMDTQAELDRRAARADLAAFDRIMNRPTPEPAEEDRL